MQESIKKRISELSKEEYHVTQEKGTEAAFTGKYVDMHDTGNYMCTVCGAPLFNSTDKFESGSGWPSFDKPIDPGSVEEHDDTSHGMSRTEIVCKSCKAHLGHVFDDGPKETTGKRYCINSIALDFKKDETKKDN